MNRRKRYLSFILLLALAGLHAAFAQTAINLHTQGRNVDFTNAGETKPFQTGSVLPTACNVGDAFLSTSAVPGQNLYICTAAGNPGTWTVQGGSGAGAATSFSALTDFKISATPPAAIITCPSGQCQIRIGEKDYFFTANSSATALTGSGGSSVVFFYVDASGVMDFGYDGNIVTGATLTGFTGVSGVTNFPANTIPLANCSVASNQFGACTDDRTVLNRAVIDQGAGVIVMQNPTTGHTQVSVNPATVPLLGTTNTFSGALNDFGGSQIRVTTGAGVPRQAVCTGPSTVGYLYVRSDAAAANSSVYACDLTGPSTWAWELIQPVVSGSSGGGSLTISGPYMTNGTNYWISGTGQQATLFNNAGFAFRQGNATYSSANNVGYVTLPSASTASDNYESATVHTTLIATLNINDPSNTGINNGTVGIAFRSAVNGVECGVTSSGSGQPNGFHPYMNAVSSAYAFQSAIATAGSTLGSNVVTLKLVYAAQVSTCYLSMDGGVTYTTIGSQNGVNSGYLTSPPTAASLNVTAGGYGASVGVYSWVLQ
jgi:hypothetical protein